MLKNKSRYGHQNLGPTIFFAARSLTGRVNKCQNQFFAGSDFISRQAHRVLIHVCNGVWYTYDCQMTSDGTLEIGKIKHLVYPYINSTANQAGHQTWRLDCTSLRYSLGLKDRSSRSHGQIISKSASSHSMSAGVYRVSDECKFSLKLLLAHVY